ncbi:MAG: ribonuclease HII [Bacteroides sp.]|nr:ribonuclease HII [Ruminococcus flavefaciens]MCM1555434.1 ribonuclease HII [Bacteroides sp.]
MLLSRYSQETLEAGCDEAGRGPLAGPVFAAAVIFAPDYRNPRLDDSKKLSEKARYALREEIMRDALSYAVARVDAEEIDRLNILNASIQAMHRALGQLDPQPAFVTVDGNRFKPYGKVPHVCVVKGDGKYLSIAAASILAKTFRDDFMRELHQKCPLYGWDVNKGYPTKAHYDAILRNGPSPWHRRSFKLYQDLTLF